MSQFGGFFGVPRPIINLYDEEKEREEEFWANPEVSTALRGMPSSAGDPRQFYDRTEVDMIYLDKTTRSLTAKLDASHSTAALTVMVCYYDIAPVVKEDWSEYKGATQLTLTNGTSYVTICDAPSVAGTVRNIVYISIYNADTINHTPSVAYDDNGTKYTIFKVPATPLAQYDSVQWSRGAGWQVFI